MSSHGNYEHELMTVRFIDWNTEYTLVSDGTPIVVQINGLASSRTLNGYVHHITHDVSPDKNYVDVTIIGPSRVFKQQSQKVWKNSTADQVVKDIAKENGFSFVAFPHPRVYEQISQAGLSDWELMVKLAKQSGYSLKCDNTTLLFQPLVQEFTDLRKQAAYFAMHGLEQKYTGIYSFKPMVGESIPFADARKATVTISGVDKTTGNSHAYTNQKPINKTRESYVDPIFDSYHTRVVAPTAEIAKHEAVAADERNRYAYRAEVVVVGTPNILPGSPLFLDGLGKTYSGYWTALHVEHNILGNKEYTTTVSVGTDSLGLSAQWTDNKTIYVPSQTIQRVITPGVRQANPVPSTFLVKNGSSPKDSLKTPLSKAKNTPKATILGVPTYKWSGNGKDLRQPNKQEKKMPTVVLKKLRSTLG